MGWSEKRTLPFRVVRRQSYRRKWVVFQSLNYDHALAYLRQAEHWDKENAHYSIVGVYDKYKLKYMPMPFPALPVELDKDSA